jgi:hypothetical protein
MKPGRLFLLVLVSIFFSKAGASQNVLMNILTQKEGIVKIGKTVFLQVTINNTDPTSFVNIYKLKATISVPSAIAGIAVTSHVLPTGWTIISNDGTTINLSNGKDMITSRDSRTLLIAVKGKKAGGPSTISGHISFSNGEAPGTEPGTMAGDNPGDNSSTTSIKVIK